LFLAHVEFGVCQLSLWPQPSQVLLNNCFPVHDGRHVEIVDRPRKTNLRISWRYLDCGVHFPIASLDVIEPGDGPEGITCFHGQDTAIPDSGHGVVGVDSQETLEVTFSEDDRFFVIVSALMITQVP